MAATDGKWTITVSWTGRNGKAKYAYTIEASTLEKAKTTALSKAKKPKTTNHKIETVKTLREPKTTTQKVSDTVSNLAKNVADDYKFAFGVFKEKITNTLQKKQLGRAEAFLNAVDSLDNVAGALSELSKDGPAKEAFEKITKATGKITKARGAFDCFANLKNCYDLGKECKKARDQKPPNTQAYIALFKDLMKANLDFLGTVTGLTAKNIVVGKLMDYTVSFGKTLLDSAFASGMAVNAHYTELNWGEMVAFDKELMNDIYKKYRNLGIQMYETGTTDRATILKVFKALRAIDNAKSGK